MDKFKFVAYGTHPDIFVADIQELLNSEYVKKYATIPNFHRFSAAPAPERGENALTVMCEMNGGKESHVFGYIEHFDDIPFVGLDEWKEPLPENPIFADFGNPKFDHEIPELSTLLVLYDKSKLEQLIRDEQLAEKTIFIEPGHEYSRQHRDFNRAMTYVIVLDDEDKAFLTPPADWRSDKQWVETKLDCVLNKYFPSLGHNVGKLGEVCRIMTEMDAVMVASTHWLYTPKDRRWAFNPGRNQFINI